LPPLENVKHETFAQKVAKGLSQTTAYAEAYGVENIRTAETASSRLMSHVRVRERVAELQAHTARRITEAAVESIASITTELNEALSLARKQGQPNHMVAASMAKAKLNGLIVDKAETTVTTKHEERLLKRKPVIDKAKERRRGDDRSPVH
jgi:hypothetical protein